MGKSQSDTAEQMNVHEASEYTSISVSTLRRRIKNGTLKSTLVKSRYGMEHMLEKADLDQLKKKKTSAKSLHNEVKKKAAKSKSAPPRPVASKAKTSKKKTALKVPKNEDTIQEKVAIIDQEFSKISMLQNQEMELVAEPTFDRDKFRQNWNELGRLIEAKISEGQMQVNDLRHILQQKERLLALKEIQVKNLNLEIEEKKDELVDLRHEKSLLRQFAEYLRGLFAD